MDRGHLILDQHSYSLYIVIIYRRILSQVAKILKKQESERTQEESADLLLHQDTVQELCSRQVRRNILKRKQEEVWLTRL